MDIPERFMNDSEYKSEIPDNVFNEIAKIKLRKCKSMSEKIRDYFDGGVSDEEIGEIAAEREYLIDTFVYLSQRNKPRSFNMHDYRAMVCLILDYSDLRDIERSLNEEEEEENDEST